MMMVQCSIGYHNKDLPVAVAGQEELGISRLTCSPSNCTMLQQCAAS